MAKITEDDLRDILNEAAEEIAGLYDNPLVAGMDHLPA